MAPVPGGDIKRNPTTPVVAGEVNSGPVPIIFAGAKALTSGNAETRLAKRRRFWAFQAFVAGGSRRDARVIG